MREKVAKLLENALEENKSLFLIDLNISEDNQIRVILDGDKGVTVEDCIAVSRAIEHNLDREEYDFSLEVMSAGVSEPLTLPRQYKKNIIHNACMTHAVCSVHVCTHRFWGGGVSEGISPDRRAS